MTMDFAVKFRFIWECGEVDEEISPGRFNKKDCCSCNEKIRESLLKF